MQKWTLDLTAETGPKYRAIAAAISRDIAAGLLRPGDRLPPQRVLADELSIDLTTVTKAYNEVRKLGLIEGGGRLGSFVRMAPPAPEDAPVDTGMNLPPEPIGGSLAARMRAGFADLLAGPAGLTRLRYQPSGGAPVDRVTAAEELSRRGIEATPDTVLITNGGQNALHAIVGACLSAGDVMCTAPLVYPGFLSIARRHGLNILPVASDKEGLDPAALDRACRDRAVKAVYVVPTNDNPTTATMGMERRRQIAEVADRHGLLIIEDDAYGQLPAAPLPSLATLVPERTWHIASLSKILSPALRVAWLRAPSVKQAWRLATDVHETTIMAPPLNAALASAWLRDGSFTALIDEVRQEARIRQKMASDIMGPDAYAAHPDGYHLWMPLPPHASMGDIVNSLRPAGLSVVSADAFAVEIGAAPRGLRLSIGGGLSRARLEQTLRILDALVDQGVTQKMPFV